MQYPDPRYHDNMLMSTMVHEPTIHELIMSSLTWFMNLAS
jgi:hypothetical protein